MNNFKFKLYDPRLYGFLARNFGFFARFKMLEAPLFWLNLSQVLSH